MQETTHTKAKVGIDLDRIRAALSTTMAAHGVSLVDIEWVTERAGWTLRLTIERESAADVPAGAPVQAGVTLEDCAEVSRDASAVLDVEDLIHAHYNLEVSSPGLDRRLRSPADFERFKGKLAKVKLSKPAPDGQRLLRGTLDTAPPGQVAVIVDGKRIEASIEDVDEARLVFELEPHQKPNKGARPAKGRGGNEPRASKRK